MAAWPSLSYGPWSATCDTLHAHTQVLGKLAVALAPPEPELQHAALRLTARGWETAPLPAPDGSGALVAALDLHSHEAVAEHSDGRSARVALTPNRLVGDVTRELIEAVRGLGGDVHIDPTPQEVTWTVPLDEDEEHATYDADQVGAYFAGAMHAALVLSEFRAAYRGRSTPVNAWWGSFDLAVSLFSGEPVVAGRRALRPGGLLRLCPPGTGGLRGGRRGAGCGALGARPRALRAGRDRRPGDPGPARRRARVPPLGVPARLRRLRLGSRASRKRRGHPAARQLTGGLANTTDVSTWRSGMFQCLRSSSSFSAGVTCSKPWRR